MKLVRIAFALAAPFMLASCLFTPGRFVSTLDIKADRSFTFTYVGEVVVTDPSDEMMRGAGRSGDEPIMIETVDPGAPARDPRPAPPPRRPNHGDTDGGGEIQIAIPPSIPPSLPPPTAEERAAAIAKQRALAGILSKEAGYRSVEYLGNNRFRVDYAISGRLDHSFVYPINLDAKSIIPWIVIEVRNDGTARVSALAFGDPDSMLGMGKALGRAPGRSETNAIGREGSFTLTTDAELVSQNSDAGSGAGRGPLVWRITPGTSNVPTAIVRFAR